MRVRAELGRDNASLLAAGVALFSLLAAFPALAAIVSIYGMFASPADIADDIGSLSDIIPAQALDVFRQRLSDIAGNQATTLSVGAVVAFVVALWSARKGMVALMQACNAAYGEVEQRGWLRQILVSLAFTFGAVVYFVVTLGIAGGVPLVIDAIFGDGLAVALLEALRWVLLWFLVVLALAAVYRYAPSRRSAKWRWVSWGAVIAATLWIAGGILFEIFLRNFGNYEQTYGALGGVVAILLWLYLSGFIVVLGAEINSELEHQTERDSTIGVDRPMGKREAYVADTLGAIRE